MLILITLTLLQASDWPQGSGPNGDWSVEGVLAPPLETVVIAAKPWLPAEAAKRIRFR